MNNLFICNYFLHPIKFQIRIASPHQQRGSGKQRAGKICSFSGVCSGLPCLDRTLTDPLNIQFLSWKVYWETSNQWPFICRDVCSYFHRKIEKLESALTTHKGCRTQGLAFGPSSGPLGCYGLLWPGLGIQGGPSLSLGDLFRETMCIFASEGHPFREAAIGVSALL